MDGQTWLPTMDAVHSHRTWFLRSSFNLSCSRNCGPNWCIILPLYIYLKKEHIMKQMV